MVQHRSRRPLRFGDVDSAPAQQPQPPLTRSRGDTEKDYGHGNSVFLTRSNHLGRTFRPYREFIGDEASVSPRLRVSGSSCCGRTSYCPRACRSIGTGASSTEGEAGPAPSSVNLRAVTSTRVSRLPTARLYRVTA